MGAGIWHRTSNLDEMYCNGENEIAYSVFVCHEDFDIHCQQITCIPPPGNASIQLMIMTQYITADAESLTGCRCRRDLDR